MPRQPSQVVLPSFKIQRPSELIVLYIILPRREVESEPQAGWKELKSPMSKLLHETNLNKINQRSAEICMKYISEIYISKEYEYNKTTKQKKGKSYNLRFTICKTVFSNII